MQNHRPPPPLSLSAAATTTTTKRTVAFTTPSNYADRLSHLLTLKNFTPLWCPTITIQSTPQILSSLKPYLSPPNPNHPTPPLDHFSAIAFTSRTAISTFSIALANDSPPLSPFGEPFTLAALGQDSTLIDTNFISKVCENPNRVRLLVPPVSTPSGLVEALGPGSGRRVLCPVPLVVGIEEPPVIPNFVRDLGLNGWVVVRVYGYETRWVGQECAKEVAERVKEGDLDAIVFTSTGEVEGLLKSLKEFGLDWRMVKKRCSRLVVAAHGPVTAAGAERLGVDVDVSERVYYEDHAWNLMEFKGTGNHFVDWLEGEGYTSIYSMGRHSKIKSCSAMKFIRWNPVNYNLWKVDFDGFVHDNWNKSSSDFHYWRWSMETFI